MAKITSRIAGRPIAFATAVGLVVVWAITGPLFGFSNTWQLVINTGTTVITFLMVFLIQATQNRDSEAIQVKLDELIRAMRGAHLALLDLEELEEKDLQRISAEYRALAEQARKDMRQGKSDTDIREVELRERSEERPERSERKHAKQRPQRRAASSSGST
jgi:low affinity Fe/Cu permease